MLKDGGSPGTLGDGNGAYGLSAQGSLLYVSYHDGANAGHVGTMPITGGAFTSLATGNYPAGAGSSPAGGYFTFGTGDVKFASPDGGSSLVAAGEANPYDVASDGARIAHRLRAHTRARRGARLETRSDRSRAASDVTGGPPRVHANERISNATSPRCLRSHPGGDAALEAVAEALRATAKRSGDLCARYGGEELVALLSTTDARGALVVAERFRANVTALQIPHAGSTTRSTLSVSLGVATTAPAADGDPKRLLAAADAALYQAKRGGRDRVVAGAQDP